MPLTTAMMATEMPTAIRPYSMAVAPFSSFKNLMTARIGRGILRNRNLLPFILKILWNHNARVAGALPLQLSDNAPVYHLGQYLFGELWWLVAGC